MNTPFHLFVSVLLSLTISFLLGFKGNEVIISFLFGVISGILIDVDHFFMGLLYDKKKTLEIIVNPKEFIMSYINPSGLFRIKMPFKYYWPVHISTMLLLLLITFFYFQKYMVIVLPVLISHFLIDWFGNPR